MIQLSGKTKATLVYALLVLGLILACLLMPGCAKQPVDSSVEGFWKLERFTTKEDGAVHEPERIFYGSRATWWKLRNGRVRRGTGISSVASAIRTRAGRR